MASDGISRLIAVTQVKVQNANDDAMNGADKQRALVDEQRRVRTAQRQIDSALRDNIVTPEEHHNLYILANEFSLANASANDTSSPTWLFYTSDDTSQIKVGGEAAEGEDLADIQANEKAMNALKAQFEGIGKDLEAEDKLGNFEIQDLMSQYNQAETLASSVMKKRDDTSNALVQKIG